MLLWMAKLTYFNIFCFFLLACLVTAQDWNVRRVNDSMSESLHNAEPVISESLNNGEPVQSNSLNSAEPVQMEIIEQIDSLREMVASQNTKKSSILKRWTATHSENSQNAFWSHISRCSKGVILSFFFCASTFLVQNDALQIAVDTFHSLLELSW